VRLGLRSQYFVTGARCLDPEINLVTGSPPASAVSLAVELEVGGCGVVSRGCRVLRVVRAYVHMHIQVEQGKTGVTLTARGGADYTGGRRQRG